MTAYNTADHLGTLGTGNHFIEVCLDESDRVWVMLHSGSRGVGNRIGTYFIELAREEICAAGIGTCPTRDLALPAGGHGALRRLRAGRGLGARLRAQQPRDDDGAP